MNSGFQHARETGGRLLAKLQRHFSPTRLLRTRDDLLPLREGGRNAEWVISRGLSLFVPVPCAAVPRKRRADYVATAVRRAAPFADPAWHTAWSGDLAMVWVWPQEELTSGPIEASLAESGRLQDAGPVSYIRRFLPESLLRGESREDGVELIRCSDGIEARAWRAGALHASSWWPQAPDAATWMTFCRGVGVPPQPLPAIQSPPWRDAPWTVIQRASLRDMLAQYQRLAIPAAVALVLLMAAWQAGALLHVQWGRMRLASEIAASSQKVSDILAARSRAEDDLAATRQLLALRPPLPQVRLMASVAGLLDPMKATVVQWSMPNPTTLEVLVAMPAPDPRALVLAFQHAGLFDDVSADIGRGGKNQVIVRARLIPPAVPGTAAAMPAAGGDAS
ncbi:MAG: hypothetical protein KGJ32_10755 [Xanthomonadaceae bacterium]|nr:hypothetical protein [Xanthomonadaceae bacterium]